MHVDRNSPPTGTDLRLPPGRNLTKKSPGSVVDELIDVKINDACVVWVSNVRWASPLLGRLELCSELGQGRSQQM